jgi:hypothetical protein
MTFSATRAIIATILIVLCLLATKQFLFGLGNVRDHPEPCVCNCQCSHSFPAGATHSIGGPDKLAERDCPACPSPTQPTTCEKCKDSADPVPCDASSCPTCPDTAADEHSTAFISVRSDKRKALKGLKTTRLSVDGGGSFDFEVSSALLKWRADTFKTKEPVTLMWLRNTLKDDTVWIDVGGNVGIYSLAVLAMRPRTRAIIFEPESQNFAILNRNIALNKGFL